MGNRIVGLVTQTMVMVIIVSIILLFLGLGVLVVIHVCVVCRALRSGVITTSEDRKNDEHAGMDKDELERLPWFHFEPGGEKGSPAPCAVCLEGLQNGDRCRLLPLCKHIFHVQCVDPWLLKVSVCPICRTSTKLNGDQRFENWSQSFGWDW